MDSTPTFLEKHSLAIRLWHWVFFLTLTGTLITVLLASTTFRTRNNTALVTDQLREKGITVTQDQARAVSHGFNDKFWELHTLIGYVLCGLLLSRILIEIFQPGDEKLRTKLRKAFRVQSTSKQAMAGRQHYLWVKWGYVVFYMLILVMGLTGLGLAFEEAPFLKGLHGSIKQIHSFTQYLIYAYILGHLIGVIRSDRGKHAGLVSGMIHGTTD